MASRFTNDPRIRQGPTTESLLPENQFLRGRLQRVEEELREVNIRLGVNRVWKSEEGEEKAHLNPWRTPSPEEERSPRGTSKKRMSGSLEEMVAQVVDGGKKRRVGGAFDPEFTEGNRVPFMVKIRGVWWEEGIGGVEVALREAGVEFCDGMRWLVGEEELKKRRESGSLASMVVAFCGGATEATGGSVGGYDGEGRGEGGWIEEGSRGEGEDREEGEIEEADRVERVMAVLKGLGDRLSVVEGSVKGVAREVRKVDLSKEERLGEKKEEYVWRMTLREEESAWEKEMDDAANEFFKASKEEFKQGRGNRGGVDFGVKLMGPSGSSFGRAQGDTSFGGRGGNLFDVWKKGS
ncbi:hypothetical protein HOY80DRAFT_1111227 [Tuber brumale]|nr:hypothetical protein HOY80DRAFT_1111227 [Tuber brumale]